MKRHARRYDDPPESITKLIVVALAGFAVAYVAMVALFVSQ